jgi:hypothetical protein
MRLSKDYFKEEWVDVFQLDSSSPSGISWKVSGNNKSIGKPVGWKTELGYWKCEYKSKSILVHRIIYYLIHNKLSEYCVVDHINGKRLINNTSEFTGVQERHEFIAQWTENGKLFNKSFKVSKYGYDLAKQMAIDFREKKIKELNQLGYNYSDRHGK